MLVITLLATHYDAHDGPAFRDGWTHGHFTCPLPLQFPMPDLRGPQRGCYVARSQPGRSITYAGGLDTVQRCPMLTRLPPDPLLLLAIPSNTYVLTQQLT